jgi:ABC-type iron transport system FetAB ATPase subunit
MSVRLLKPKFGDLPWRENRYLWPYWQVSTLLGHSYAFTAPLTPHLHFSGKSSLLLCLMRLLDNSSGNIMVDNEPRSAIPRDTIRSRFIAVTQEQFVLPGTVRQNHDQPSHRTKHHRRFESYPDMACY